jgi:hypothetical protein
MTCNRSTSICSEKYIRFTFFSLCINLLCTKQKILIIIFSLLRSRNNQQNAQICTTDLFYMLAPTCFDSSLPSSGIFWTRLNYVKIQTDMVVYHIMWLSGPCVGVSWFSLSVNFELPAVFTFHDLLTGTTFLIVVQFN